MRSFRRGRTVARPRLRGSGRRVAIIGTRGYPSYYGGFETAVRRLAPYLADHGWDVRVYGRQHALRPDDPGRDPRVRSVTTLGIDSKSLSTLTFGLTACLHACARKPDVALVMNVANGYWLPVLKLRGIRTVVNVDGIEWERDKWSRLGKLIFRFGARMTARFADELIYDAQAIGDYWRRTFGRDGVYIPYGGDPSEQLPLQDDLEPGKYVLYVARLVPENTLPEFVEAAKVIAQQHEVVIVGSAPRGDPMAALVEDAARTHDRIRWLGHIDDERRLYALWQHAGVYFHGHSVGGTNPGLVQAMALGATIVARDTAYNREVLDDAGVLCPSSAEAIVTGVMEAVREPGERGCRARDRARAFYGWSGVCASYSEVLHRQAEK